jgi:hypothetical protein
MQEKNRRSRLGLSILIITLLVFIATLTGMVNREDVPQNPIAEKGLTSAEVGAGALNREAGKRVDPQEEAGGSGFEIIIMIVFGIGLISVGWSGLLRKS